VSGTSFGIMLRLCSGVSGVTIWPIARTLVVGTEGGPRSERFGRSRQEEEACLLGLAFDGNARGNLLVVSRLRLHDETEWVVTQV
jgi:hypothetical protein